MKPDQLSFETDHADDAPGAAVLCVRAVLPMLTTLAVALASSIVLTLAGCASSAGIAARAQVQVPAGIPSDAMSLPAAPALSADWWRAFGDSTLNELITRALADNPGLKVAQARLARADAAAAGAQANAGPQVNGSLDVARQRFSATSIYPPPLGGSIRTLGTAQIGASWEIDFFGRHRAAIAAAVGTQRAASADAEAARVLLASTVARSYVQLARLVEQRDVAERSLKQRDDVLALIRQRVLGGLDTTVEQRQGEGALPESRQLIEAIDEQITLARHALAALSAQAPDALDGLSPRLARLKGVPLPAAVPADLLGRRADIAAARWRVEASDSDVQSARAQFYPNINLSAFIGLASIGLEQLVKSGSEQYGAGPALRLPIFDAGRLRANLRGKAAEADAAVESYNSTVIDAVHDVADQIASLRAVARQQAEQASAQAATEAAYDLSRQRYQAGLGNYLTVLNAEAAVLIQRRLAVDLKARAFDSQIALARALGGGYTADADTAPRMAQAAH